MHHKVITNIKTSKLLDEVVVQVVEIKEIHHHPLLVDSL